MICWRIRSTLWFQACVDGELLTNSAWIWCVTQFTHGWCGVYGMYVLQSLFVTSCRGSKRTSSTWMQTG